MQVLKIDIVKGHVSTLDEKRGSQIMWTKMQITHKNLKRGKEVKQMGASGGPVVMTCSFTVGNGSNFWLGKFHMPPGATKKKKIIQMENWK